MKLQMNRAYKPAKEAKERYRVLYGGAGSGKSYFVGQETILNMLADGGYSYLVVRKTGKSIRNSVFQLLMMMIEEYDLGSLFIANKTDMSIFCITGARLVTSGLDDTEKLKSIYGINRIWVEEANEISETDQKDLDLRMRGINRLGYQMTMTFNPISELHWLKRKYFDVPQPNVFVLKTTYKDNKYLDEAYRTRLEELINEDYQYYRIYALGEWGSLGNLIFTNWQVCDMTQMVDLGDRKVPMKSTFDNYYNGLDFGYSSDPLAFERVHLDPKNKVIYVTDELYQRELQNDETAKILKPLVQRETVTCDSAEPKSIADLRREDINAKGAKKGKDSVSHGIQFIKGYKVMVSPTCIGLIRELGGYKWREDKDGNILSSPIEFNNHGIDALRYALEPAMLHANDQWGWQK
jgi:phage terminase large subunit